MNKSLLKKIGLVIGGFGVLMALGLLANKDSNNNNKEEIFQVSESKFPLSDYFFEEVKEEPKKEESPKTTTTPQPTVSTTANVSTNPIITDYSHLNNNLNKQHNTLTHLQQVLQSPPKIKPKPKHTKEQLEFLNTRLKPLEPTKPATKPETEYKTAGYRQKFLNNRILIFNPYGDDNTCYFNPFDKRIVKPMNFDQRLRLVQENANNVFISEEKGEDHWVSKAKDLFSFYALHDVCSKDETNFFDVAMGPNRDYVNLIDKRSRYYKQLYQHDKKTGEIILDPQTNEPILIPNVNARKLWYLQVSEQKYADPKDPRNFDPNEPEPAPRSEGALDEIVRNDARAWANSAEEEFASIISTFNRFVSVFKSNQVRIATSKMSFDYEELRTDNISLYIVIAQKDINTLAPLVRVILESIAKNLLANESSKKEERIYMILDEFVRFGKLPFLLEMPALCRSYNVVPLFITQDYAMIRKYYSDDDLKILKGVVHYNIVFKMNSAEDAEIVSKEVGEFTRQSKNYSTEKSQLVFGGSSSYSHEGRNLLTAQDIMNIESDEVIVIVTGAKATPLKLKANYWFKDKKLLKRASLPIDLEVERKRFKESTQPTTEIATTPNQNKSNLDQSNKGENTENKDSEGKTNENNPTTSQEKNKNENTEQENNNEIDEILKKPLSEISMEEKRALFKKMQQGDEQSEQEVLQDTQS
ncbi:type IV secretory system conjugative DNA transfer family protein [Helicobacter pylori]